MTNQFETIEFRIDDGFARLALNRPDKLNCFNETMHAEVRTALDRVEADETCRALLLTANGRGFCAGQDLSDRVRKAGEEAPDLGISLDTYYNPLIRRLRALELPVVCAVNGVAAGAGANLALACDIVLAARGAKFMQTFSKVGLIPDSGGTWILPRVVGTARATALAMLAETVTAQQAEEWGMIWRCINDDELQNEADSMCRHLATRPTRAMALIKQALSQSATNSLDAQLDLERDLQRRAGKTNDYREGVTAFMEKRKPVFKGN
jgi:2-(1,2-epoxy-1,2-dihydrophenyl)acetyl-CoA isomerase